MISFELSDEQNIIQSMMNDFATNVLRAEARRVDDDAKIDEKLLARLWETELVQSQAADDCERSPVTSAIVLEELAAADASFALALAAPMAYVQAIADHGSAKQRSELLGAFTGPLYQAAAIALAEPSFGFDVSNLATNAILSGETFTLNGKKAMVSFASQCSHFLVIANSNGAADAFIVPSNSPGVSVAGPKRTLGLRALELAEVTFENVAVPISMRLGEGNGANIQKLIDSARVGLSAIMTGLSRSVVDYVIPYTKERIVHGTALARKQKIAFDIADMHMETEAMRWMTWKAAWELEANVPATKSAQLAYTYGSGQVMSIADRGLQALGGHGYVTAHPVEMWYRNARALGVLEGLAGV